ncbi:GAF domain-containing protein [Leptolyngbya sp. 15MV]|nr:GAF domain-containing protein [Leptolyngbya sp. 15MV]
MLIDDGQVTMRYQRGYTAEQERAMIALRFSVDDKPFCDTIRTGKPYVSPAVHAEGFWRDIPELEWIESYISTPIRAYDQVIGFLNLYADMQNAFTAEDADHLQAFADQAAIAIENAQLYDAISRDAAEMRSLHRATSFLFSTNTFTSGNMLDIGARIAQAIVREFPRVNAAVYMIDPGASILTQMASGGWIELEAQRVVPLTPGSVYYQAVMEGEITVRADLNDATRDPLLDSRTRAHALIPLVGMGTRQTVGLLDLQSREPNAFTEQSLRILEAFAVRVAALIENLRLYQEIQRRVQERTAELNRVKERVEAILNPSSGRSILDLKPFQRAAASAGVGRAVDAREQVEAGGLPRAVGPDEPMKPTRRELEREVGDGLEPAELDRDRANVEGERAHGLPFPRRRRVQSERSQISPTPSRPIGRTIITVMSMSA